MQSDTVRDGEGLKWLEGLRFELHSKVALGSAFLIGFLQWKLMPNKYTTLPMFDMLYDAKRPYSEVLMYVNQTASAVYALGVSALIAMSINGLELVLE